jgi:hypothetical protein
VAIGVTRLIDLYAPNPTFAYGVRSRAAMPHSVAAIARRLWYDRAYVLRYYPGVWGALSARYEAFRASHKANRAWRIHREVHEATLAVYHAGAYPGNRKVKAMLRRAVIMREPAGSAAWHEALAQLRC